MDRRSFLKTTIRKVRSRITMVFEQFNLFPNLWVCAMSPRYRTQAFLRSVRNET